MRRGRLLAGVALLALLVVGGGYFPRWLFSQTTSQVDPWTGAGSDSLVGDLAQLLRPRSREQRVALSAFQLTSLAARPGDRVRIELRPPRLLLHASIELDGRWWNLVAQFEGARYGLTLAALQLGDREVPAALVPGLWDLVRAELHPRFQNLLRNLRQPEVVADSVVFGLASWPSRGF